MSFLQAALVLAAVVCCSVGATDIPCGKQAPGNEPIDEFNQQYIGGGIHAKPHSWPWAAAILDNGGREPLEHCGGTVVDKRWILTAGHCTSALATSHVKLGADDRGPTFEQNEPTQQIYTAEKTIRHPKWDGQKLAFDLTLVKLDRDIEFNDNIRQICLPDSETDLLNIGEWATTIGWGLRDTEAMPEHRHLQQLKLPVLDPDVCNQMIHQAISGSISVSPDSMVCAGYSDIHNSTGVYGGDSGSALMAYRGDSWKLFGVTSWRYRFNPYLPGVWAYVPKMIDWVKQTIQSG